MQETVVISTTIDRARHTVLVVDDDPATRYATARVVRAAGFQTQEAATGGQALKMDLRRVSAVVLDVHLPDMTGFDVCRAIRARPEAALLPIIHLSAAYVQDEDKVTGLNAGADAYLVHPVEPAVLIATLQALIRARMAEDSLRRSEARFRAIYDQAPSGMALIDGNGNFADVNPAMTAMLGRSREALLGQAISAFAPPDWAEFIVGKTIDAPEESASWQGEFPLLRPDGSSMHLEWSMSAPIEPGLRIGIAVDISERVELENRRQEVLEREQAARVVAERHSRTKDDFIAVLSHELRTPLNSIAGWLHILTLQSHTPQLLQKALGAIERSVKAQTRIISDILDVSRISSGKLRLYREWTDPAELVTDSIDALRSLIDEKKLTIAWDATGVTEPAWLDPTRFQQIVWNLMTNAIKFSRDEGVIRVELAREGDVLKMAVQDFGRGIPKDFLVHLFGRFTQNDSPGNRHHGGLGLGLSIVKHLVELHGGSVTAESEGKDKGTTLRVELLVDQCDADADLMAPNSPELAEEPSRRPLDGLDVLVVEDNIDSSEILTVVLADGGASVRLAADYESAVYALGARWPDVLVSDIGLPGRDGYDLIRHVREQQQLHSHPGLFAIALTALSRPQDQKKAVKAGFDVHLSKPLQPHLLLAALARSRAANS